MRKRIALLLVAASLALPAAAEDAYKVVVHRSNPADSISRRQLSELFLKTVTHWPSGRAVQPVELRGEPEARAQFARQVLGKSLSALRSYWNKAIFSGREVPPVEMPSDEDVISYVRSNEGAVGVVSGSASTARTKVLAVTD